MTSSMATGERRWASARRGGMTVLGKVAVPKPINLPSQRLENHGLDPNLEIVPKGTLSWGSRPSSSGSNAWGTSGLSPRTDGGSSPPTHFGGRPSSGGGTRPLTAGSEKGYDSNANAWGSNSRPSSASGVLASNNSSLASLRPRSADTRPGSSQLSRFAEPSAENFVSQASTATSERMIIATAGNDGFSLTSGDFPTLGSEKDEPGREAEPLAHGTPGSASGRVSTVANNVETAHGDEIPRNADFKGNSWRKDSHPYVEDGVRPGMETWHGEHQSYPNHNMAHPHFESWRGAPPVNPPGGVWYRGPLGPPPYGGPPGAPGGFPMDPYPYYRPQVPPGGGTHAHHSKNGDMYRPPISDSYMRPVMPIRPGFYPGPVPYESYYGPPPMGFCNPNERDLPFMGMPPGPSIYNNRPLNPNGLDPNPNGPDPNHSGPSIYSNRPINPNGPDPNHSGPRSREHRGPDQVEPGANDPRGNYKILTKQNDRYDQNDGERWGHRMSGGVPNREKGILSKSSIPENAWGGDYRKDRENTWEGDHNDRDLHYGKHAEVDMRFSHPGRNVNELDASPIGENAPSPRDHSLIQKIEGLNAKARVSEGRRDDFYREPPHEKVHIVNSKDSQSSNQASSNVLLERHYTSGVTPVSRDTTMKKSRETTASSGMATSRSIRGVQSRGDTQGRRRSESQTSSSVVSGSTTNDEVPKADAEKKSGRASVILTSDLSDTQRAKMKEIARQRAIQLQKEEEERIREQKAKALAKLEELDRRSGANQGIENPTQKSESCPSQSVVPQEQPEPSLDGNQRDWPSSVSLSNIGQTNEKNGNDNFNPAVSYLRVGAVVMKIESKDSISSHNQSQEANPKFGDGKCDRIAPQVREASKQKRVSHKQRQNISSEKNSVQDSISIGATEEASGSLDLPVHQKKKNNKSGKNKHKGDETLTAVSLSEAIPNDPRISQASRDDEGKKASDSNINPSSKDLVQPSEDHSSLPREDAHDRQNNSRKAQHSWKPRNSQSNNKVSEKSHVNDVSVVWAPVRSHNKFEVPDDSVPSESGISMPRNNSKTKRAEMERYVPKPVAKELAQQESIVQEGITEERLKTSEFSDHVAKVGSTAEFKNVPKQPKAQGSWRQRLPTEETHAQSSKDSSIPDETLVGGMRSRPDEHSEKGSLVSMDDGWNIVNEPDSTSSTALSGMKTRDSSGKGKRHPVKGYRGSGFNQNFDRKDSNTALVDSQLETSQAERIPSSKENRDRSTSHWQPKSQGNSVKGHPNQASTVEIESASSEPSNVLNEQRPFSGSGYRKNTNYGGRFNRGHETPQENKHQHSSSINPERQRQNSHFEYQPVGPNNNNNRSNDLGAQKDNQPQPGGQRFRERGNNYSRRGGRGNFYGNTNDGSY